MNARLEFLQKCAPAARQEDDTLIVLPESRIALITPPHTASRNLHYTLCRPPWNGMCVVGPCPDKVSVDHHYAQVPEEWRQFTVAVVIRRPLDRAVGLWQHLKWWHAKNGMTEVRWAEFVDWVYRDASDRLSWLYRYSIIRLLDGQPWDRVIRYERLQSDLAELLGTSVEITGERTNYDKLQVLPTSEERGKLMEAWAQDFRVFAEYFI